MTETFERDMSSSDAVWRVPGGALALGHCGACDELHHYPRPVCPWCGSIETDLIAASGGGVVHTFTVTRNSPDLTVHAFVELDEGVSLLTQLVGVDPDAVAIGDRVEVDFSSADGAPRFRPVGSAR